MEQKKPTHTLASSAPTTLESKPSNSSSARFTVREDHQSPAPSQFESSRPVLARRRAETQAQTRFNKRTAARNRSIREQLRR
jgi:hypothetical protein